MNVTAKNFICLRSCKTKLLLTNPEHSLKGTLLSRFQTFTVHCKTPVEPLCWIHHPKKPIALQNTTFSALSYDLFLLPPAPLQPCSTLISPFSKVRWGRYVVNSKERNTVCLCFDIKLHMLNPKARWEWFLLDNRSSMHHFSFTVSYSRNQGWKPYRDLLG